jgi:putative spermidine/putrescine transport system substrate-binding protein
MAVESLSLSRRSFAKLGAVLGLTAGFEVVYATSGAARIASAEELEETDTVIIGVYSGDWESNINAAALDAFADESDLDVIVVAGADAEWLTKLQAAQGKNVAYDLLILQPDSIQKLQEASLLQPISTDDVPNVADFAPSINERFTVDGKLYAAGFSMGQLGIAYRTDLVENPPASWADLWNDEYAGKLGVSPLTYSAGLQFFWALTDDGADVDGAFERLEELKPNIVAYPDGAGTLQTLVLRGDIAVVPFWDGRVFAWQEQGEPVAFVYPEEGAVAAIASWVIPVGAPNLANAYRLLDYLSSPEVQGAYAELSYYGMSNEQTAYSDEFLEKAEVGAEFYDGLSWVDYAVATPNLVDWSNRWSEVLG